MCKDTDDKVKTHTSLNNNASPRHILEKVEGCKSQKKKPKVVNPILISSLFAKCFC